MLVPVHATSKALWVGTYVRIYRLLCRVVVLQYWKCTGLFSAKTEAEVVGLLLSPDAQLGHLVQLEVW